MTIPHENVSELLNVGLFVFAAHFIETIHVHERYPNDVWQNLVDVFFPLEDSVYAPHIAWGGAGLLESLVTGVATEHAGFALTILHSIIRQQPICRLIMRVPFLLQQLHVIVTKFRFAQFFNCFPLSKLVAVMFRLNEDAFRVSIERL